MRDSMREVLAGCTLADALQIRGRVSRVVGMTIEASLPHARVGSVCELHPPGGETLFAQVVGLREESAILMPLGPLHGLTSGTHIRVTRQEPVVHIGDSCIGRVLDGLGRPIDGFGPLQDTSPSPVFRAPINPLQRVDVHKKIDLGIRSLNALVTCGEGQRLAVIAGAGVGKSTLLSMIARHTRADVAVVALIGERGAEVQKFVRETLSSKGHKGDVVIVAATSDEPPALRLRAAFTATAISEHFRERGKSVLLMMDSLTRVVMAQREIGLSIGEAPATRGYPPSAFAVIANLLERAGQTQRGSITGIYTTLVQGDDPRDPVGDAVRAVTDGHILLSREIASRGQYPAVDVLGSLSRCMNQLVTREHAEAATHFRSLAADYNSVSEMVSMGAYRPGTNPRYDLALRMEPAMRTLLMQDEHDPIAMETSIEALIRLSEEANKPAPRGSTGSRRSPGARS